MRWPLDKGYVLTSSFEQHRYRVPPSNAPGVDLACPAGTAIRAPRSGWVFRSGKNQTAGQYMWLISLPYVFYICHLSSRLKKVRQRFNEGEIIAHSGNSGKSSGAHLHLAVQTMQGGRWGWRNPLNFLPHFRNGPLIWPETERPSMYVGVQLGHYIRDRELAILRQAQLTLYKAMIMLNGPVDPVGDDNAFGRDDWDKIRGIAPARSLYVIRAYANMNGAVMPPAEFVQRVEQRLVPLVKGGPLWDVDLDLEVHNEPNHPIEGFGPTDAGLQAWLRWYPEVYSLLTNMRDRRQMTRVRIMFPGLAPGQWNHKHDTWLKACTKMIRASESVGSHCYWQTRPADTWQLVDPGLGQNYLAYQKLIGKRKIRKVVTEAGNANPHNKVKYPIQTAQQQADEYVAWCGAARGRIDGVAFFTFGLKGQWREFEVHPETIYALGDFVKGLRE